MEMTPYSDRRVLVTGGTGFIGQNLVRHLVAWRARVVTFARGAARLDGVEHVRGDIRDEGTVGRLIERNFDYVFHLAGVSGQVGVEIERDFSINCRGLVNVLAAIRRTSPDTALCFSSSRLVYGRTAELPVGEDHERRPLSPYAAQKREAEDRCLSYARRWGMRTVVLRFSNPFGPHSLAGQNRYNVANWMIDELCRGRTVPLFGRGAQLRDYIYVDDAIEAMLAAAASEQAHGQVFNVGSGVGTPLREFVRAGILAAGGGSYRFESWPAGSLRVETGDYVAGIERIRATLGWSPHTSLMEGVTRTVAAQRRLIARRPSTPRLAEPHEPEELEVAA
jgi:UDP-glucose 4-epimerase